MASLTTRLFTFYRGNPISQIFDLRAAMTQEHSTQARRSFLKSCTTIGAVAALTLNHRFLSLRDATAKTFEDKVGSRFLLQGTSGVTQARLQAVDQLAQGHSKFKKPFSLLFELPSGTVMSQGTYTVFHADLGQVDLLLAPVSSSGRQQLEAIIS